MTRAQKSRGHLIRAGILSASFLGFIPFVGLVRQDSSAAEATSPPAAAPVLSATPAGQSTRPAAVPTPSAQAPTSTPQQTQPATTPRTHTRSRAS